MKIGSTKNTPQFNGYKNVINNMFENPSNGRGFGYMSMQLDNLHRDDLKLWHTIQKKFLHRKELKDTITFGVFNFNGKTEFMLTNFLLKIPEEDKNTPTENIILQAFTLIARLTKDIKNKMPIVYDKDFSKTLLEAREDLAPIFSNDIEFVNQIMLNGISPSTDHITPAKIINNEIQKEMSKYFEV